MLELGFDYRTTRSTARSAKRARSRESETMSFDAESHVLYRIANAPILRYPFPHFYVADVFPADFYRELRARLPELAALQAPRRDRHRAEGRYPSASCARSSTRTRSRVAAGEGTFWSELEAWPMGDAIRAGDPRASSATDDRALRRGRRGATSRPTRGWCATSRTTRSPRIRIRRESSSRCCFTCPPTTA